MVTGTRACGETVVARLVWFGHDQVVEHQHGQETEVSEHGSRLDNPPEAAPGEKEREQEAASMICLVLVVAKPYLRERERERERERAGGCINDMSGAAGG